MATSDGGSNTQTFAAGGYRFMPGVFQYSAGVAALDGFEVHRVRFRRPLRLQDGFARIAQILKGAGRPLTAFCACELRSPAQFSEDGFRAFNTAYVDTLGQWGIYDGQTNPVARSNVCPEVSAPEEPEFHAFSYTVEAVGAAPSFVVAGSGEAPEGKDNYRDHIVRLGDVGADAIEEKADFVLTEMERRLAGLGFGWADVSATQLYTVYNIHHFLEEGIAARGAMPAGLTWHYARPPIVGLDFEMDCRGVPVELVK
jgi:hypothetical protein